MAFIVPLLEMIQRGDGLKAIVIAPTRELTIQLYKEFLIFEDLTQRLRSGPRVKFMRKNLTPTSGSELKDLTSRVEILIATPLKLA